MPNAPTAIFAENLAVVTRDCQLRLSSPGGVNVNARRQFRVGKLAAAVFLRPRVMQFRPTAALPAPTLLGGSGSRLVRAWLVSAWLRRPIPNRMGWLEIPKARVGGGLLKSLGYVLIIVGFGDRRRYQNASCDGDYGEQSKGI